MGEVYRAHDEQLQRDVALKVLPASGFRDEMARARLLREARAAASLNHPYICAVYDVGEAEGQAYIAMELVPGRTLTAILEDGPLPWNEALRYALHLADAVAHAHARGTVHRDLKSQNTIVTPEGRAKVLDFGLAKRLPGQELDAATVSHASLTQVGAIVGTLAYIAPEVLRGEPADPRSDVWALGVVMYEMLTGRRPFGARTGLELSTAILRDPPPPLAGDVPPGLKTIIERCLEKDPARRYQSAREVLVALECITAGAPLPALPERKKSRKRLAAVCAVLVVAFAAIALWLFRPRPVLSFVSRDWILVTDFENETRETIFDRSLFTAFGVSLEQSTHANVFPQARVQDVLQRMKKAGAERIDEALGREICARENIRGLITPSIAKVGQQYLLSARLLDPRTGEAVRSYSETANGQDDVIRALGSMAGKIRRDLGESLFSLQRSDRPLPRVTTASLEALKLYAEGSVLWNKGKFPEAVDSWEAALRADGDFAMAHASLGNAFYSHRFNNSSKGKQHFDRALQLSDRTTKRERQQIQANYQSTLGHLDEAARLYNIYLQTYPDDWPIRSQFGYFLMMHDREEEAIAQYKEAVRLAPSDAHAYLEIATSYSHLGKYAEALSYYDQAFKLEPSWITLGNLNHEYGFTFAESGQLDKARKVFDLALEEPKLKGRGSRSHAILDLFEGKYGTARTRFKDAISFDDLNQTPLSASRDHHYLAMVFEGLEDKAQQRIELDKAARSLKAAEAKLGPQVWLATLVGVSYARSGAAERAGQILEGVRKEADLQSPEESSRLHRLEGETELARGRQPHAVELLLLADHEYRSPFTVEALAHAYRVAGDPSKAISTYEALMGMYSQSMNFEPQQAWFSAHYDLAGLQSRRGDQAKARQTLDALLRFWGQGDADLPLLKKARRLRQEIGD